METSKYRRKRVGDCRHCLDENVESDTYNVFTRVTDCVSSNGDFVNLRALAVSFELTSFDVFLGVIERTTAVTHEDSTRNGDDSSSN